MKKRILALMMSAALLGSLLPVETLAATNVMVGTDAIDSIIEDESESEESLFTYELNEDNEAVITAYSGSDSELTIPATVDGYTVVGIGASVFSGNETLTSVTVSDGMTSIGKHAFDSCTNLQNINLPDSVTSIDSYAFESCSNLQEIVLPDSLVSIGQYAFDECDALESVVLPENLESLGYRVFQNCDALASVYIPKSLESARSPFEGCYALKNVEFGDGVTMIASSLFESCGLEEIVIPDGVTEIGEYAFSRCTSLISVGMSDDVISIDKGAFYYCLDLASITLSENLQTIGDMAFYYCFDLQGIVLGDCLTSIGSEVFYYCYTLSEISFPNSLTSIGSGAFEFCSGLKNVSFSEGLLRIGDQAFYQCSVLKDAILPKTLQSLGEEAFAFCSSLGTVYIPKNLKSVGGDFGNSPFNGCVSLEDVEFEDGITEIVGWLFKNCTGLEEITIPDGVTEIGEYAFSGCSNLSEVVIPDSVVSIDYGAFNDCTALASVTLPENLRTVGDCAFSGCIGIEALDFPESMMEIGSYAFSGWSVLKNVVMSDSVETIGEYAFENCTALESITLSKSVDAISYGVFCGCTALSEIHIPDAVTDIGGYAFQNSGLTAVAIPSSCETIGEYAFQNCSNLASVEMSDSVKTIGEYAFQNCLNLVSIEIPDSVKTIGSYCFDSCSALKNVTLGKGLSSIPDYAFSNCSALEELVIPYSVTEISDCAFENDTELTCVLSPKAVTNVEAERTTDSLTFTWDASDGVAGYLIEQYQDGEWNEIARLVDETKTEYQVTGLAAATEYQFRIRAYVTDGSGSIFYGGSVTITEMTSPAVTGLEIGERTATSLQLNWTLDENAEGYIVEQNVDGEWEQISNLSQGTSTMTVNGLEQSTTYRFRVKSYIDFQPDYDYEISGNGDMAGLSYDRYIFSEYAYVDGMTGPACVSNIETERMTNSLAFSWDASEGASGYIVERYEEEEWTEAARLEDGCTTEYQVTGLSAATEYQFRIRAYATDDDGTVLYSEYVTIKEMTLPETVSGFEISKRSGDSLSLKWNRNSGVGGYIIEQEIDGVWEEVVWLASGKRTYVADDLNPAESYRFRIKCYVEYAASYQYESVSTASRTARYMSDYTYVTGKTNPTAVSGLKIGGTAKDALRLNWTKNTTASGYIIEQYKNGSWIRIAKIKGNSTVAYRVEGLSANTTYQFRMKAYAYDGSTALYSTYQTVSGTTKTVVTAPSAVSGLKIGGRATNALRLNWTKNSGAGGYIIEQYKSGSWTRIARIASNSTTTYRVEGLSAYTTYKFRIKAFKTSGSTALYSSYKTISGTTLPTAVTGLKIGGKATNALRLNWTKNSKADGYIIEQYKNGKWTRLTKITNTSTVTYRVSGLSSKTTYKFRIKVHGFDGTTAIYSSYTYVDGTTN